MNKSFKVCTMCAHDWESLGDLIKDENLHLNGYQASFNNAREGLFMFTHIVKDCGTTIAIHADQLMCLYDGPEYTVHTACTERCEGHCLREGDLSPCYDECGMRWVRDITQILRNRGPDDVLRRLEDADDFRKRLREAV